MTITRIVSDVADKVPITLVVAAKNESENIAACLDSFSWVAELLVAEWGSADDTVQIAEVAGARVISEPAPSIGAQRNLAIAAAKYPWILVADADERSTVELREAIIKVLANPSADAYRLPRRNIFMGREIRHGGWDRDHPVRLFRSSLRYNDSKVHEHVIVHGTLGRLNAALWHYPYPTLAQYFEKFARYSGWWADQQFAKGRRANAWDIVARPPAKFMKMYVVQRGFLDGMHGLVLAALAAASVLAKYVRLWGRTCES